MEVRAVALGPAIGLDRAQRVEGRGQVPGLHEQRPAGVEPVAGQQRPDGVGGQFPIARAGRVDGRRDNRQRGAPQIRRHEGRIGEDEGRVAIQGRAHRLPDVRLGAAEVEVTVPDPTAAPGCPAARSQSGEQRGYLWVVHDDGVVLAVKRCGVEGAEA